MGQGTLVHRIVMVAHQVEEDALGSVVGFARKLERVRVLQSRAVAYYCVERSRILVVGSDSTHTWCARRGVPCRW